MTIEELREILASIEGNSAIANAKRRAIMALIAQLMAEREA